MTTEKQRAANRRNAEKSTGPKTIEGRERSKLNALKHGLTAAQIIVFDESAEDLENFHQGLIEQLLPMGALEEQLVERIAICAWRLRRVYRIEARLFAAANKSVLEPGPVSEPEQLAVIDSLNDQQLGLLLRLSEPSSAADAARVENSAVPLPAVLDVGAAFKILAVSQGPLFQLSRHETTIERSLHRALHDLERLQARRKGEAVTTPVAVDISVGG
jgi:hypothetical protein